VDRSAPTDEVTAKRNAVDTIDPTVCAPHLHSILTLVLKTSDGSLDEELPVDVRVFSADTVQVRGKLPVPTLNGTLSVAEGVVLDVTVDFAAGAYRGYIVASKATPPPGSGGGVVFSVAIWTD
jgi:hypothetical protein